MFALFAHRNTQVWTGIVFGGLMLLAAAFRLPMLDACPMHSDEAINADKLGVLLERGEYKYSAVDYHGPTLNYLTWVAARARGMRRYVELNETTLRMVPALAGILLVGLHFWLVRYVGLLAASVQALLVAVSPAMVYYSRDYIHEMLLVLFSFGCLLALLRYWERKSATWAAAAGVCAGLMFATKETAVLPAACMGLATVLVLAVERRRDDHFTNGRAQLVALAVGVGAMALTTVLLLSAFFTNLRGASDLLRSYRGYVLRGMGVGTPHVHPWNYYPWLMNWHRGGEGILFSELLVTLLALAGIAVAFRRRTRVRLFLAVYGISMVAAYSILPYKAPWNFLEPMHGLMLLSGLGVSALAGSRLKRKWKVVAALLLGAGVVQLGWQAWEASYPYACDPQNPWVYAHTGRDVFTVMQKVELLASSYPAGRYEIPIAVVSRENLWPLPWYLRRYHRVQWWNGISDTAPEAPVYLITPDMEAGLTRRLYEVPPPGERDLYVSLFDRPLELRPGVELRGFASLSVWEGL